MFINNQTQHQEQIEDGKRVFVHGNTEYNTPSLLSTLDSTNDPTK